MVRKEGKLQVWGIVVSIFEMDQNWNQLGLKKPGHILKTIFQYFYYVYVYKGFIILLLLNTLIFKVCDYIYQ